MGKLLAFYIKVGDSPELVEELRKIMKTNNIMAYVPLSSYSDEAINALIPFAKKAGFDFTLAEFKELANEAALSDNDLEAVVGGDARNLFYRLFVR